MHWNRSSWRIPFSVESWKPKVENEKMGWWENEMIWWLDGKTIWNTETKPQRGEMLVAPGFKQGIKEWPDPPSAVAGCKIRLANFGRKERIWEAVSWKLKVVKENWSQRDERTTGMTGTTGKWIENSVEMEKNKKLLAGVVQQAKIICMFAPR